MRTKILSVTPVNPLGVTAPLMNKGSQENGVNAIPCQGIQPLSHGALSFIAVPAPLTQGSREVRSISLSATQGSRERVQFASVAIPYQNVCAVRTLICFSCAEGALHAPKARFMRRRRASCAEGALHVPKARFICGAMCRHSLVSSGSKREWRYRKSRQSGSENTAVHTACGAITV